MIQVVKVVLAGNEGDNAGRREIPAALIAEGAAVDVVGGGRRKIGVGAIVMIEGERRLGVQDGRSRSGGRRRRGGGRGAAADAAVPAREEGQREGGEGDRR